jgi:hypothetical protein
MQIGLRAMYDITQDEFRKAGITHVSGWRGYGFKHNAPNLPAEFRSYSRGHEFEAELNALPMTSWAYTSGSARGFASGKAWGYLTKSQIPVENVISLGTTGFGTGTSESEFIALFGDGTVHHEVVNVSP